MENKVSILREWIKAATKIAFFGGAGVSTESGIPDFRSTDGLYSQKYDYPPETILSHSFYVQKKAEFYRFYREKMLFSDALPNMAHFALSHLELTKKSMAVITQNIDGLHQKAGSRNVFELHGSVLRNYCECCHNFYGIDYIKNSDSIPKCVCGGDIKPDVVLYEEGLDTLTIQGAIDAIRNAELLIIGGTSLSVYPASGLIDYYRGDKLVLINKTATPKDGMANLHIMDSIGKTLSEAIKE